PDGRIVAANVRLGAMLKTAPATLVGRSIADWVVSKDRAELLEHVGGVLRAGGTTEIECTFERADGEARSVHARIGAMNAAELEDTVLMQLEDVTSWKRAEAERAELTLQLAQAQRLDSIGQLAGGVAHDFNNVLQAISISLELLGRPECSEERRASVLLSARGATERAAGLVRQLLAFSRRDPGEQRVFDVRELVTSTVAMLERLFPANITLTTRLDERPCLIRADWSQLDQLVLNLCLNGRDSIEGDGNVEVSVTMIEERSKVRLEVRDDGAGIPEGLRDRVFEPFFTTKEPGKGTGLGLSVVYGIVQRHLGTIRIAGEAPHGTRVTIDLPAAQAGAEVEPTGAKIQSAVGGSEWILLAEDDLHVREVVAGTLRDAGYRVHVAVDGASAVELFEAAAVTPDAVILDIVMPRMGGREV
ncbi:MAG: response regulator, partial [Polyangiaceae bacterium]|nr:response regulator [Polyangiaceae bacterium]